MYRLGIVFTIFFGILVGVANALVWFFGFIPYVREMIPYALFLGVLLLVTTAILKAACGSKRATEDCCISPTCKSVNWYTPVIMITAAIFLVFAIIVLATSLSFTIKTILAFIGAISFWIMLLSFVAMIVLIIRRCFH